MTITPAGYTKAILLLSDNIASQTDLSNVCKKANDSGSQLHLVTYTSAIFQYFKNIGNCPGQVYLIQSETLTTTSEDLKNCYSDLQKRAQLENVLTNIASTILPDYFEPPTVVSKMKLAYHLVKNQIIITSVSCSILNKCICKPR